MASFYSFHRGESKGPALLIADCGLKTVRKNREKESSGEDERSQSRRSETQNHEAGGPVDPAQASEAEPVLKVLELKEKVL